jgi:hypothetical protein
VFDALPAGDARPVALLKKATFVFVAALVVLALTSGYRAWFQVYSLELRADGPVLGAGSVVRTAVVISGRASASVRVELIQGGRSETLDVHHVAGNEWAALDPRPEWAAHEVTLAPELLARFHEGPATLRATATGRPQWTRLPPPTVRETPVELRRER